MACMHFAYSWFWMFAPAQDASTGDVTFYFAGGPVSSVSQGRLAAEAFADPVPGAFLSPGLR